MHLYSETAAMLDEIVAELPEEFLRGLNMGILLEEEDKHNPRLPEEKYCVMGEYRITPHLGRSIHIYYGSFMIAHVDDSTEDYKKALRDVFYHELRHHLESLAGSRDLEIDDEIYIQEQLRELAAAKQPIGQNGGNGQTHEV